MMKRFTLSDLLIVLTIIVCVGTIFSLFSSFKAISYNWFFNTDTLYLPSIYKDIFIDHHSLKGWHFNPAPNFFPDMIVYFLIMAVSHNFIMASFVFAIVQYLFLVYLIIRLCKTLELFDFKIAASLSNLFLLLFFMDSFYSNHFDFAFYLVNNSYHTGAFVMSLFCTILTFEYLKQKRSITLIYLAIILLFSIFSDRLTIVLYSIPWLLMMVFYYKIENRKELSWINVINISTTVAGLLLFKWVSQSKYIFIDQPHRIMKFQYFNDCLKLLLNQLFTYLEDGDFKSLIIIISLITFVSIIIISVKKGFARQRLSIRDTYFVFSFLFTVIVFFAPLVNGNYTGFDTLRYNIYLFFLLIINFGILISSGLKGVNILTKIIKTFAITLAIVAAINMIYQYHPKGMVDYFSYYPPEAESIDNISKREKLQCGLAKYTTAKFITMFSRNGVRIYSSSNTFDSYFHVMNENWYKSTFNFFILEENEQEIEAKKIFNEIKRVNDKNMAIIITPPFRINTQPPIIEVMNK